MAEIQWKVWTQTVQGPSHIKSGLPNQDSALVISKKSMMLAVVADGVSSKPHSDLGSKMVCNAAKLTAIEYTKHNSSNTDAFAAMIYDEWRRLIGMVPSRECATTCLIALRHGGELLLGQFGDGLIGCYSADEDKYFFIEDDKDDSFSNITKAAFSETYRPELWQWRRIKEPSNGAVMLCTDGISENFEDDVKKEGFIKELYDVSCTQKTGYAAKDAERWLTAWPTKGHYDDKTIAFMYTKKKIGIHQLIVSKLKFFGRKNKQAAVN